MANNRTGSDAGNKLVLLAEDDSINRKVTQFLLERLGYQVDVALNGIEVLHSLEYRPYDLVLMNIGMPLMDGFEAASQIRRLWKNELKIIAITARVLPGIRNRCLSAGMDDCIEKPVKLDELAEMLEKHSSKTSSVLRRPSWRAEACAH